MEFVTLNVLCKLTVYLNLFDDVDHSLMHWLFVIYALFAESFTNYTHYSREVFIVCTKNHRVVSGKERGHKGNSVCLYNYTYYTGSTHKYFLLSLHTDNHENQINLGLVVLFPLDIRVLFLKYWKDIHTATRCVCETLCPLSQKSPKKLF